MHIGEIERDQTNVTLQTLKTLAVETPAWIKASTSRRGFEDITPEDTNDGDDGRLLERAYEQSVRVLASPKGLEYISTLVGSARKAG